MVGGGWRKQGEGAQEIGDVWCARRWVMAAPEAEVATYTQTPEVGGRSVGISVSGTSGCRPVAMVTGTLTNGGSASGDISGITTMEARG